MNILIFWDDFAEEVNHPENLEAVEVPAEVVASNRTGEYLKSGQGVWVSVAVLRGEDTPDMFAEAIIAACKNNDRDARFVVEVAERLTDWAVS